MKKYLKKLISLSLMFIICSIYCTSNPLKAIVESVEDTHNSDEETNSDFQMMCENKSFILSYNESLGDISLKNKNTGYQWFSNPQSVDDTAVGSIVNTINAQLVFHYYNGQSLEIMDTYGNGVANQVIPTYKVSGNVLSVVYKVGDNKFTSDLIPPVITKKRMEEKVLSKLTNDEKDEVSELYTLYKHNEIDKEVYKNLVVSYPSIKNSDIYIFNTGLPNYRAEKVYKLLVKAGYTTDDLQYDCDINKVENKYKERPYFNAQLDYELIDDGLKVTLDPKKISFAKEYPPVRVDILPFFGASDEKQKGYMFVPDGCGSVINFNNKKINNSAYEKKLFNENGADGAEIAQANNQDSLIPVFALSNESGAFYATIDSGYEVSGIFADIAGRNCVFNRVHSFFTLNESSIVSISNNSLDSFVKTSEKIFSSKISVSYHFTDKSETYSNIAVRYRNYLLKQGILKNTKSKSNNLNLTFYGAVEIEKSFLGIPYKSLSAYTTLKESESILKSISCDNVDIRLSDFTSGGKIPTKVSSLKLQSCVGKTKDIPSLYNCCDTAYVSICAQHQAKVSTGNSATTIAQSKAYQFDYNFVNYYKENDNYTCILSPKTFTSNAKKLIKSVQKRKLNAINIKDIGYQLNADMKSGNEIDKYSTRKAVQKYLSTLSKKVDLSVDKGSIFSFPYAKKIWDIPMDSSNYQIEDFSVPFYQIAISGSIEYVAPPFNESSDVNKRFLKAIEYGAEQQFALTYRTFSTISYYKDDYYGFYYKNNMDNIKKYAKKYESVLTKTAGSSIINHSNTGDTSVTEYENGVKIYINYSDSKKNIDGVVIEPQNFLVAE